VRDTLRCGWAKRRSPETLRLGQQASNLAGFFLDADFQRPEELSVLVGEVEFGDMVNIVVDLLAVHHFDFTAPIEADGHFQHQEKVVAGRPDAPDDIRDLLGVRNRLVDRAAQFLDQAFEVIVKVQFFPDFPVCYELIF